jgi:glutaconate CoA-transferase, subunit A
VVGWVESGAHVAFGGFLVHNKPAALVRALARAGVGGLHLYSCPTASYDADVLIGAGLVAETVLGNVSFDYLGAAPRFQAAAMAGSLHVEICDEAIVAGGYMATIEGIPYHPLRSARGHDVAKGSRLLTPYRAHTGHDLTAVSPIAPDVAVLHVQQADEFGNGRHLGAIWGDELILKASKRVILTTDELISNEEIRRAPGRTTVPGYFVDAVVHLPYGAHPCASHGRYFLDEEHLREYLAAASTDAGFASYTQRYVTAPGDSHERYLEAVGGRKRLTPLRQEYTG